MPYWQTAAKAPKLANKKPPRLNFVRSFECSARHLSFTRAAEELACTQAAVSMHVRSLEKHLGVDLFVRYPRSLKLTEAGEAYLPTLRQALLMIDAATEAVQINRRYKTVTIAAPISLAENWLSLRIATFRRDHPDIDVILHGTIWDEDGGPDSNIVIFMGRSSDEPHHARLLMRENLALLCTPELARAIEAPIDITALPKIVVLGRQEYWMDFARALQLPRLDMTGAIRTNGSNIALEMAAHGAGTTVLPIDLAQTYKDRGLLVEPFDQRPPSSWNYYIRESSTNSLAASQKLHAWLLENAG